MAAEQEPGLGRGGDPRQGMAIARGRAQSIACGGGLVVPTHHFGALGLKGLQEHGHQGCERHLEQPQERPGGPGVDGHFGGFLLRKQVTRPSGPGCSLPAGSSLDHGGVVNNHAVRGKLVPVLEDGFLVQGH